MIGSVDQYAKILGKSVTELADQKYQPPPAENSESEVILFEYGFETIYIRWIRTGSKPD